MKNFDAIIAIAINDQIPLMEASDTTIEWTPIRVLREPDTDGVPLILCMDKFGNLEDLRQDHLYIHLY